MNKITTQETQKSVQYSSIFHFVSIQRSFLGGEFFFFTCRPLSSMLQRLNPDLRLVARSTPLGRDLDRIDLTPLVSPRQLWDKGDQVVVVLCQLQKVLTDLVRAVVGLEPGRHIDARWAPFVIVVSVLFESNCGGNVALTLALNLVDGRWKRRGNIDGIVEDGNG